MSKSNNVLKLTERELDVLRLINHASSNQEISEQLCVSVETVRSHAKNIYRKLDVSTRQQAAIRARELGLLEDVAPSTTPKNHHLPLPQSIFIGRKQELGDLSRIFADGERLITILGVGGMGKTRIALEFAYQQHDHYKDGVYFVPLDTLSNSDNIPLQIADSLSLPINNNSHPQHQLLDYLQDKHMLLVIDNWEHVLDGVVLVADILNTAPHLHIIATSRERLSLLQEVIYPLGGLSIPQWANLDDALNYDAVQLLEQTAQRVQSNWQLEMHNRQAVYDLCQMTLGMPLAIVMAASWLDTLSLEQIVQEIQNNLDFLETNLRDIPDRHRSIYAVFDWTWQLLPKDEKQVFMKLSVFRNGLTFDAATAVTGATPRILQSLINKSLLLRHNHNRYMIHELLRQYGETKLQQSPDIEKEVRDAHCHYYAGIAEDVVSNRLRVQDATIELENLYAAWYWATDTNNTACLCRYAAVRGLIGF